MMTSYQTDALLREQWLMTHKFSPPPKRQRRRVAFSECSKLHVYEQDDFYAKNKAYTADDRERFGKDAVRDGMRIKFLIDKAPPENISDSIKYLLRHGIITRGELIGIEHHILGTASSIMKARRHHAAKVLRKQSSLKMQKLQDDPIKQLGTTAQLSSIQSTQRARVRAAMAA